MPAKDILHDVVREALIKDGWSITHDPFPIAFGRRKVYADLGAERTLAAEKAGEKIVVEIKSFLGLSKVTDLERAIGQYVIYRIWLNAVRTDYLLYIALDRDAYEEIFVDVAGQLLIEQANLRIIVVDIQKQEIVRWIS